MDTDLLLTDHLKEYPKERLKEYLKDTLLLEPTLLTKPFLGPL
jgi:hypothetical protein